MSPEKDHWEKDSRVIKAYDEVSIEEPSDDLDKIIMAAAFRELEKEKLVRRNNSFSNRFWNMMRFPVSIAGALFVTVAVAHLMWPFVGGEYPQHQNPLPSALNNDGVKVIYDETYSESNEPIKVDKQRVLTSGGISVTNKPTVNVQTDKAEKPQAIAGFPSVINQLNFDEMEKSRQAKHWASEIVQLAKDKEFKKMRSELEKFSESFPGYPIMERLRPYVQ